MLIAVIGRHWLTSWDEEGERRIDNPEDSVRVEIATALKRDIPVIPVLVDGASMPRSGELPDDVKALARRNSLEVSHTRFKADSERLIGALERIARLEEPSPLPERVVESPAAVVSEQTERRQALGKAIDKTLKGFAEDVAKAVSGELIPKMRSAYIDWYRKGGRLIDVEEKIKAVCKTFSAERIVAERSSRLQEDIKRTTLDFVRAWLKEHGVSVSDDRLDLVLARDRSTMAPSEWNTSEVMSQQIAESFTGILAGILGVIGGVVAGGGGVALIMSGPIGWIIGAAIGVAAVLGMKGEIKEQIKTWPFKGWSLNVLHTFVAEKKLVEKLSAAEAAFNSSLTKEILQDMEATKKQLINYLDESVEAVAKRLSMLGQISPLR